MGLRADFAIERTGRNSLALQRELRLEHGLNRARKSRRERNQRGICFDANRRVGGNNLRRGNVRDLMRF